MSGVNLPQQIYDFTMQRILPNLVDNVNNSNIFWGRAFAKPETWEGVAIWSNLTTQNNTTGGSYSGWNVMRMVLFCCWVEISSIPE